MADRPAGAGLPRGRDRGARRWAGGGGPDALERPGLEGARRGARRRLHPRGRALLRSRRPGRRKRHDLPCGRRARRSSGLGDLRRPRARGARRGRARSRGRCRRPTRRGA